jgi:hypothetical protein
MTDTKELRVNGNDNPKRIMYLIKEMLLAHEVVTVIGGIQGSSIVVRAVETLQRLGYINFAKLNTETIVLDDRRISRIVASLSKTKNFKKLYDENEEKRKQIIAENNKYA